MSKISVPLILQVMLAEKNPYIWDPFSDSLTTPMVSLTLRDDLDRSLNVTGLTNPVDVYISNSSMYKYPNSSHTYKHTCIPDFNVINFFFKTHIIFPFSKVRIGQTDGINLFNFRSSDTKIRRKLHTQCSRF